MYWVLNLILFFRVLICFMFSKLLFWFLYLICFLVWIICCLLVVGVFEIFFFGCFMVGVLVCLLVVIGFLVGVGVWIFIDGLFVEVGEVVVGELVSWL